MSRIEFTAARAAAILAYERACALHAAAELDSFAGEAVNVAAAAKLVDALHPGYVEAGGHYYTVQCGLRAAARRYAKQLPEMVADIIRDASFDDAEFVAAGAY